VEVVVLGVTKDHEEAHHVHNRCVFISPLLSASPQVRLRPNSRMTDAFLPVMYLKLYHSNTPLAFGFGAGPRGSFS